MTDEKKKNPYLIITIIIVILVIIWLLSTNLVGITILDPEPIKNITINIVLA